jgi:hypothetical protein
MAANQPQGGSVKTLSLDISEINQEPLFDVSDPIDPLEKSTIWIGSTKY